MNKSLFEGVKFLVILASLFITGAIMGGVYLSSNGYSSVTANSIIEPLSVQVESLDFNPKSSRAEPELVTVEPEVIVTKVVIVPDYYEPELVIPSALEPESVVDVSPPFDDFYVMRFINYLNFNQNFIDSFTDYSVYVKAGDLEVSVIIKDSQIVKFTDFKVLNSYDFTAVISDSVLNSLISGKYSSLDIISWYFSGKIKVSSINEAINIVNILSEAGVL